MRLLLFTLLTLVALASASIRWKSLEAHKKHLYSFEDFKIEFGRVYKDEAEEQMRKQLFETKLRQIHKHNSDKTKSWKQGVNQFSDLTDDEFRAFRGVNGALLSRQKTVKRAAPKNLDFENLYKEFNFTEMWGAPDANVDWRTKNVVTAPKDQGACGSCWSFSTAETIESFYALKNGPSSLVVLSEQQILDCTPNPNDCGGTGGCGGGTVELATARIMTMGGLSLESSYPYASGGGQNFQCNMDKFKPVVKVQNYYDLPSNQLAPVLNFVASKGPLSISVDASSWSAYDSGVFDGCDMTSPDIDHAVQLVGYGTDPSAGDYWLVRNSWGTGYGENGYIRLKRYATPPCGVDKTPGDGDGCNGGPSEVTVCGNCGILYDTVYVDILN